MNLGKAGGSVAADRTNKGPEGWGQGLQRLRSTQQNTQDWRGGGRGFRGWAGLGGTKS